MQPRATDRLTAQPQYARLGDGTAGASGHPTAHRFQVKKRLAWSTTLFMGGHPDGERRWDRSRRARPLVQPYRAGLYAVMGTVRTSPLERKPSGQGPTRQGSVNGVGRVGSARTGAHESPMPGSFLPYHGGVGSRQAPLRQPMPLRRRWRLGPRRRLRRPGLHGTSGWCHRSH